MPTIEYISRALIQTNNHFLACRDKAQDHASLPGGHIEFGETAQAAVARELQEECGLAINATTPLLIWESKFIQAGKPKHEFTTVFHVEHAEGKSWPKSILSLEDHISFEWIAFNEAHRARLLPAPLCDWLSTVPGQSSPIQWLSIDEID